MDSTRVGPNLRCTGSVARAWVVTLVLPVLMFAGFAWLVDGPRPAREAAHRERRAALAIRDVVDPVEIAATWAFVGPRLARAYGEVRSVTERLDDDGEARRRFVADFRALAAAYPEVDVYCLAHGNDYVDLLRDVPRELTARLRVVYNSGCTCGAQAGDWLALGADSYVAHPEIAAHAPFFFYFARRWWAGATLAEAATAAQAQADAFFERLVPLGGGWHEARDQVARSPGTVHGDATLTLEGSP
ncbi:MAG: hypothetical protein JNM10_05700 [Planctomycetia bacterium]|nr:hypothetical protein [Planctomycetia bacterium]